MIIANTEPAQLTWKFRVGDTINLDFDITDPDDPTFTLAGTSLKVSLYDRNGILLRTFDSGGGSPEITISGTNVIIYSKTAFTEIGSYRGDMQWTDVLGDPYTIADITAIISKQFTV